MPPDSSHGTPEARVNAKATISYTETYEDAVKLLKESYELNRVVYSHHLEDVFQSDYFKDERKDFERMRDRIKKNVKGLKLSQGYTAEQLLTAHFE